MPTLNQIFLLIAALLSALAHIMKQVFSIAAVFCGYFVFAAAWNGRRVG